MTIRKILAAVVFFAFLFVQRAFVWAAPKNVVVIVADDLGRQLGCYGDTVARTPHIDALAADGTRFAWAFCTTASCSPSRSVILTGLHNHANGQYGLQHATHNFGSQPFVKPLPMLLKQAFYRTCSIGKVHVQPEEMYRFERYANDKIAGGRNTVRMAENAEQFIREDDPRPFFLYFCPTDPHRAQTGFANEAEYPGVKPVKFDPGKVAVPHYLPDQPEVRRELAEYYESIARVDQGVGRLVAALKAAGHFDDTLIVFLSDNGPPFPGAKTNLYDAGTHLPLIIRAPDQKSRGVVSQALVNWTDLVPTILEFSGAKPPAYALQGRSLLPILETAEPREWDEIYQSHSFHEVTMYYPMRSIRTRKFHYILNIAHELPYPFASDLFDSPTWQGVVARKDTQYGSRTVEAYVHRPRHELYDLQADPQETVNLADRPDYAKILSELQQKVRAWQKATGDPWLIKYEHE
ncbi:MAG: sulfatase [Planctomycetia bacterium]|nr:sulfatase [Planctomycetia bacterium]